MKSIIVITGPTRIGKTKLSIMIAKKYNGEIINADSMQVYRGLDIGTAKINNIEKDNISHYLFDIVDVSEEYSIYNYQKDCRNIIEKIFNKGKTPILVGGTGLYIKSALYDYKLIDNVNYCSYDDIDTNTLYNKLIELDEKCINKINRNNRKRIINALNYYMNTNNSITDNVTDKLLYNCLFIGLTTDRNSLYSIIDARVDKMIANGLLDEVKFFYNKNIRTKPLLNGIGYKELYQYLDNKISFNDAIALIKRNSRHYAKRQYTFMNNKLPIKWFNSNINNFDITYNEICNYIDNIDKENIF